MKYKKIKSLFDLWPLVVLFLVWLALFVANMRDTYLLGWDNLFAEGDVGLNLWRNFHGVWLENRGVGLADGLSFIANLPHTLISGLLAMVMPAHLIRYVLIMLLYLVGGVGILCLMRELLQKREDAERQIVGLVSAVFYMLNLATIQMFYTPYEVFVYHFAFLPWLLYLIIRYLRTRNRADLIWFFCASVLSLPQGHVPTLFLVYIMAVFLISIFSLFGLKLAQWLQVWVRIATVIFLVNAFWILPYVYSFLINADVIAKSKINITTTSEVVLYNRAFADLPGTALMRGFNLIFIDHTNEEFGFLMETWRDHVFSSPVEILGFVLFGLAILGVFRAVLSRKWQEFVWVGMFGVSYFMLGYNTPILRPGYDFLVDNIPLFFQAYRFVFTKFATLYALSFGVLLGFGVSGLWRVLMKVKLSFLGILIGFMVLGTCLLVGKPAFEGKLFYENLRVNVPVEYSRLETFFESKEKSERIAVLPVNTFWGWTNNRWGHRGSGWLWQVIDQPMLDRAFDPWSVYNETFYNEASYAVYKQDSNLLANVFDKYGVSWVLLDESIFNPGGWEGGEYYDQIKEMMVVMGAEQSFDEGSLEVYKIGGQESGIRSQSFISAPESYTVVDGDTVYGRWDPIYEDVGEYVQESQISNLKSQKLTNSFAEDGASTIYPFAGLSKERLDGWRMDGDDLVVSRSLPDNSESYDLKIPDEATGVASLNADINTIDVRVKNEEKYIVDLAGWGKKDPFNCDLFERGGADRRINFSGVSYVARNQGAVCEFLYLRELNVESGYGLRVVGENLSGRSLKFYVSNNITRHNDLEVLLPTGKFDEVYVLLPQSDLGINPDGEGYTLSLETRSFGAEDSINVVERIEFYPIPVNAVAGIKLIPIQNSEFRTQNSVEVADVEKWGTSHYRVGVSGQESGVSNNGLIVLSQGYEEGWNAYILDRRSSIVDHRLKMLFPWWFGEPFGFAQGLQQVKVNGWANGFRMQNSEFSGQGEVEIVIVYWPQYLQWGGFVILIVGGVLLAFWPRKKKHWYDPVVEKLRHIHVPRINFLRK